MPTHTPQPLDIYPNLPHLIWIDLEMTGLNTQYDSILEIATIITDKRLDIIAEGPVLAIYQPKPILLKMDDWNVRQHSSSGLLDRVRKSQITEQTAEAQTLDFVMKYVPPHKSPMCGNSICQDRRFLARCMPKLEDYFHYRNLDVSTLNELARRWKPSILLSKKFKKKASHLALEDVRDSIAELQHYQAHLIQLNG
jgi:oligoribonuclease